MKNSLSKILFIIMNPSVFHWTEVFVIVNRVCFDYRSISCAKNQPMIRKRKQRYWSWVYIVWYNFYYSQSVFRVSLGLHFYASGDTKFIKFVHSDMHVIIFIFTGIPALLGKTFKVFIFEIRYQYKSSISMHTPPKSHSRNIDFFHKQQRTVQYFFS